MIYLYWILGIIGYITGASFTFGFIAGTICKPYESAWEGPAPFFMSLVWPITLLTFLGKPSAKMGRALADYLLQKEESREEEKQAKIRIAQLEEKRTRLELDALERELEEDIRSYDEPTFERQKYLSR